MAAEWWSERLQQGDREAFKAKLTELVVEELLEHPRGLCLLQVDYDPQGLLLEAVRAAGVECAGFLFSAEGILPAKHWLGVSATELKPKEGYGKWTAPIPVPP
jgi:hypothetical protein